MNRRDFLKSLLAVPVALGLSKVEFPKETPKAETNLEYALGSMPITRFGDCYIGITTCGITTASASSVESMARYIRYE